MQKFVLSMEDGDTLIFRVGFILHRNCSLLVLLNCGNGQWTGWFLQFSFIWLLVCCAVFVFERALFFEQISEHCGTACGWKSFFICWALLGTCNEGDKGFFSTDSLGALKYSVSKIRCYWNTLYSSISLWVLSGFWFIIKSFTH